MFLKQRPCLLNHTVELNELCPYSYRVDFEKYPGLAEVEFYNATMQAGDCLFIPQKWYDTTRSYR